MDSDNENVTRAQRTETASVTEPDSGAKVNNAATQAPASAINMEVEAPKLTSSNEQRETAGSPSKVIGNPDATGQTAEAVRVLAQDTDVASSGPRIVNQQPTSRVVWPTKSRLFTRQVRAELAKAKIPLQGISTNPAVAEIFDKRSRSAGEPSQQSTATPAIPENSSKPARSTRGKSSKPRAAPSACVPDKNGANTRNAGGNYSGHPIVFKDVPPEITPTPGVPTPRVPGLRISAAGIPVVTSFRSLLSGPKYLSPIVPASGGPASTIPTPNVPGSGAPAPGASVPRAPTVQPEPSIRVEKSSSSGAPIGSEAATTTEASEKKRKLESISEGDGHSQGSASEDAQGSGVPINEAGEPVRRIHLFKCYINKALMWERTFNPPLEIIMRSPKAQPAKRRRRGGA
ncbi:hypothetical protein V8F20_001384 [Naviculisporaceae sp. PSN 640]